MKDNKTDASKLITNLIANLTDWRGETFAKIREVIVNTNPEIIEEWKWMGTPVWSRDGQVCLANPFKDKVKLTFPDGASLSDPDRLFNNGLGGKKWRTIDFYKGDKINEKTLASLIRSAIAYNEIKIKAKK